MNQTAQGTIEYLIIMAIVVVISLIAVGVVVINSDSPSQQLTASSNEIENSIGSTISVSQAVVDSNGNSIVELVNNTGDNMTLTKVKVGDEETVFNEQIVTGDGKLFSLLNSSCVCASGQKYATCNVQLYYTSGTGLEKIETRTISVECVSNTQAANPSQVVGLGEGTSEDPWIINSCKELQNMRLHLDGNYALNNDIDCADTINWNNGLGFQPIGSCGSNNECYSGDFNFAFNGKLDGKGHKIKELYINGGAGSRFTGLTAVLGARGVLQNLVLEDVNVLGGYSFGALAGSSYGTISNINLNGVILGYSGSIGQGAIAGYNYGTIEDTQVNATLFGSWTIGGITGSNKGSLIRCSSSGIVSLYNLTSFSDGSGGLAGGNSGTVNDCYSDANVSGYQSVGGLLGSNYGSVISSHASGYVIGTNDNTGGLIGYASSNSGMYPNLISGSYYIGSIVGKTYTGGLIGELEGGTVSNSYSLGVVTGTNNYTGGLIGNMTNTSSVSYNYSDTFVTGIDYVGGFAGKSNGEIKYNYSIGDVNGRSYVGGFVGYSNKAILNNYATGDVNSTASYSGGLIGYTIIGASTINNYATGNVNGVSYVGGLVGYQGDGSILNNYSLGSVTGTSYVGSLVGDSWVSAWNNFALGRVTGTTYSNGLFGRGRVNIIGNYWDTNLTGKPNCYRLSSGADSNSGCYPTVNNPSWYYSSSNAPLSSWTWGEDGNWIQRDGDYPILSWQQ